MTQTDLDLDETLKEINVQYARERIKQIDSMIPKIDARIDDALNNSRHHTNERTRELERRNAERYTTLLADMQAERAVLSRRIASSNTIDGD